MKKVLSDKQKKFIQVINNQNKDIELQTEKLSFS